MLVIGRKNRERILIDGIWVAIDCITDNQLRAVIGDRAYILELGRTLVYGRMLIKYRRLQQTTAHIGISAPKDVTIIREELLNY